MKHTADILCPQYNCSYLQKNGRSENGIQHWRCRSRKKSFQLKYTYEARVPSLKEQIDTLILTSSGVRDTAGVLGINENTVIAHLKNGTSEPRPWQYKTVAIEDCLWVLTRLSH